MKHGDIPCLRARPLFSSGKRPEDKRLTSKLPIYVTLPCPMSRTRSIFHGPHALFPTLSLNADSSDGEVCGGEASDGGSRCCEAGEAEFIAASETSDWSELETRKGACFETFEACNIIGWRKTEHAGLLASANASDAISAGFRSSPVSHILLCINGSLDGVDQVRMVYILYCMLS